MLLTFLLSLLILYVPVPQAGGTVAWQWSIGGVGFLAALNGFVCWIGTVVARNAGADTRSASGMRGARAFQIIKMLVLGLVLVDVLVLKWPLFVYKTLGRHRWAILVDDLLLLLPVLIMMATVMAFRYRFDKWMGGVSLGLWRYLWLRFRVETGIILAGWLLLVTVDDVSTAIFFHSRYVNTAGLLSTLAAFAVLAAIGPLLIGHLWQTSSLPTGPLRDRLEKMCEEYGFRYRDILVWHTHKHLPNAGVIGIWPRFRYVLVTDALLAQCTPEEVEGVFAHEVGHVRYHHLAFYMLFALAFLCFYLNGIDFLAAVGLSSPVQSILSFDATPSEGLLMLGFAAVYWVFIFGFVSRRLEQQADIFSMRAASDSSAFLNALEKLARLSRAPRKMGTWRHFSLGRRIDFLRKAIEDPEVASRSLKRIFLVQWTFIGLFVLGLLRLILVHPDILSL